MQERMKNGIASILVSPSHGQKTVPASRSANSSLQRSYRQGVIAVVQEEEVSSRAFIEEEEQREINEFIRYKQWMHTELQRFRVEMEQEERRRRQEEEREIKRRKENDAKKRKKRESERHALHMEKRRLQIEQWESEMRATMSTDVDVLSLGEEGLPLVPAEMEGPSGRKEDTWNGAAGGEAGVSFRTEGRQHRPSRDEAAQLQEEASSAMLLHAEALRVAKMARKLKIAEKKQQKLAARLVKAAARRQAAKEALEAQQSC